MRKLLMTILWPSFVVAIVTEGCFFSLFEPSELLYLSGHDQLPPIAAYTIGFFFFWIVGALASFLTHCLSSEKRSTSSGI